MVTILRQRRLTATLFSLGSIDFYPGWHDHKLPPKQPACWSMPIVRSDHCYLRPRNCFSTPQGARGPMISWGDDRGTDASPGPGTCNPGLTTRVTMFAA